MSGYGLMTLQHEKEKNDRLIFDIGFQYLHDPIVRSTFMVEEHKIVESYLDGYRSGRLDFSRAMDELYKHFQDLNRTYIQLQMGSIQLYAITQKTRDAVSIATLSLKGVGFAGGAFQVVGGFGFCVKVVRSACGKLGVPLMVQGAENMYENGYYLFLHKDPKKVPVREAYRYIARLFGKDNEIGDIAFSSVDIALSAGSLGSLTRQDGVRKLFHYIREDFVRGWRAMGAAGIGTELVGDASSGFSIYQIVSQPETNWSELKE